MKTIGNRNALTAAIICALGTGLALAGGVPLLALAGALVACGVMALALVRAPARRVAADALEEHERGASTENAALMEALTRDVARAERYGEPLTVCMVGAEGYAEMSVMQREAVTSHLRSTIERVTRSSDSWFELGDGRFAVVLERCSGFEANSFAERVALASGSRPVVAEGGRVRLDATTANTQYDPHQFVGARDFAAAVFAARLHSPGHRQRLVSDGRFLREQLYGKDRTAGAA